MEQHEKMVAGRFAVKNPQKAPRTPGFADKDQDDSGTKDEQEPAVKDPQKELKNPEFVDKDPGDSSTEDEQQPAVKHPQKAPKPRVC